MTWIIDSAAYADASSKCHTLATDLCLALGPLHRTLIHDTVGMAGDHQDSEAWTTTYDQHTADILTLAATLCNALQRFGDVLAANGYNWWYYNRATASGPEPDRPTASEPLYDSGMEMPASAKGDNGPGIDGSAIAGLMEQVGRIPNGDVTKLGVARDAWKTFSTHTAVTGAADRIKAVTAVFAGSSDPNHDEIETKLTTLGQAAQLLSQAATGMVTPVTDHHDALNEMRGDIQTAIANATQEIAAALAITVAVVAIAAIASAGLAAPAAAGGGTAVTIEIVQGAAVIIKNAVSVSRLVAIFGAVVVAGTASGGFTAIPDLTNHAVNATLAGIAAMVVKVAGDDGQSVPGSSEGGSGNAEEYTAADVDRAAEHLAGLDHFGANDEMLQRIRDKIANGEPLSDAQKNFMKHELTEAELMEKGMSYEDAHEEALKTHPPGKNYDPDVIDKYEEFGPWWRKQNGLPPR